MICKDDKNTFLLPPETAPVVSLGDLLANGCQTIPQEPGIYWVLAPEGMSIRFHRQAYHPKARLYEEETLRRKFETCTNHRVLYIGKAEGKRGLRQRLKQYMDYGQGKSRNHQGGRAIWQVEQAGLLLLAYQVCQQPGQMEKQLLQAFRNRHATYPLANWRG